MFEKLYYGNFKLNMNCREFDVFLQAKLRELGTNGAEGHPVFTIEEFLSVAYVGFALIKSDEVEQIIGVAYRDSEYNRAWMAPTGDHTHTLFLDCPISMLTGFGLIVESGTGHIISPMNDNKIILEGKAYK